LKSTRCRSGRVTGSRRAQAGRRITFSRFTEDNLDVYTMGPAGRHITRLTRATAFDFAPDWGSVPN
jgi:Tol biopolymer transport system component